MFKNILVPVDGSELSDTAVTQACRFAGEVGARLTFYHARPSYFPGVSVGEPLFNDVASYATFQEVAEQRAASLLQQAEAKAKEVGVESASWSDEFESPYEGIIAAAESRACDLIFMASHGRRGASALLLGSEAQKVLTHCKIPVLIYR